MFDENWSKVMLPVAQRTSLESVSDWYWQTVNWRINERKSGRGTAYDADDKSIVNRGMLLMKFPWLSINDLVELVEILKSAKKRNRGKVIVCRVQDASEDFRFLDKGKRKL